MKNYLSASLIWMVLFLCSCGVDDGKILNISTHVISNKTDHHEKIKGTKFIF